jgi:hypothetical protein
MRPAVALAISALVVALVIGAGIGIDWAMGPHPSAAFSKCRTAPQLAPNQFSGPPPMCIDPNASYSGTLKTTKGDISFNLLTKQTPKTVNNFIVLAENGYFNGMPFWHSEDWVIQTGDPLGNGKGGPGYTLPPEPPAADEQWAPGSMGMSRFPDGTITDRSSSSSSRPGPGATPRTCTTISPLSHSGWTSSVSSTRPTVSWAWRSSAPETRGKRSGAGL